MDFHLATPCDYATLAGLQVAGLIASFAGLVHGRCLKFYAAFALAKKSPPSCISATGGVTATSLTVTVGAFFSLSACF